MFLKLWNSGYIQIDLVKTWRMNHYFCRRYRSQGWDLPSIRNICLGPLWITIQGTTPIHYGSSK